MCVICGPLSSTSSANSPSTVDRKLNYTSQTLLRYITSLTVAHSTRIPCSYRMFSNSPLNDLHLIRRLSFVPIVFGPSFSGTAGKLQI